MKIYLFLLIACLLSGCGGSNNTVSPPVLTTIITTIAPNEISTVVENTTATLTLQVEADGDFKTQWQLISGPATFFQSQTKNSLTFISPNVEKEQIISIKAVVTGAPQSSKEFTWTISIKNKPLTAIINKPEPNVFSSANLDKHLKLKKDALGIPLLTVKGIDYYYPVSIAAYSYDLYNSYYKTGSNAVLTKFITNATWLRDNCIYTQYGFCSFRAHFPITDYKLVNDWTSAMAQGQAISSLIAAYYITQDKSYEKVAYDALIAFLYPLKVKGLTADFNGVTWFEEYGSTQMPAHVLNGFIFSLSGIRSFVKAYDNDLAKKLFNTGVNSLINNIDLYDLNFTSRYDYSPLQQISSEKGTPPDGYHELHIFQLAWLFKITHIEKIQTFANKFLAEDMSGVNIVPKLYKPSVEIQNITASYSALPLKYGVNKLTDANWTWNKYWLADKFPVDLTLTLNKNILNTKILNQLVITSVSPKDFPNQFDLISVDNNGDESTLRSNITLANTNNIAFTHNVNGYNSYTVTFDLKQPITSNKLIIRINKATSNKVKIRELDIQYPREKLFKKIMAFYKYP